jgi:hypothetical protein
MAETYVKKYSIAQLWGFCRDRLFAVPEIQREFVWDRKRVANLLDSIWRQLPIGILLIWEADISRRQLLRHAQNILPSHDDHNKKIWFIIDGQQRLSTLYRALEGGTIENSYHKQINFDNLCFVFDKRFEPLRFGFVQNPNTSLHIPIRDIMASDWRKHLQRKLVKKKISEIEKFRNGLKKYTIPVVFVETNELDEIRETFLRINSGGLRISKADRAFSRAARLDMRRLIKELIGGLPNGFDQIDPSLIQASITVMRGQKEISGAAVEKEIISLENEEIVKGKVSKNFTILWRKMRNAISKSIDYLCSELKVVNWSFVPSDNMIPVLSYFFFANNLAQPDSKQRRELRKWFWATGIGGRYSGRGYYQNIRSDLDFMHRLARKNGARFTLSERIPKSDLRRTDYTYSSSMTISYLLMLCLRKPRYLENGAEIPLDKTASVSNRKDKHHIFSKALLRRNGFSSREINSICNMCYVVAEENQSIGDRKPSIYLKELRQPKYFASVMKSHFIPYKSDSGLWEGNIRTGYRKFINQRMNLISRAFEKEAGMRLFKRD